MNALPHIPHARPAPVHDTQLDILIRIAGDIEDGNATQEAVVMFMGCIAPCLRELQQRRAAATQARQILDAGNVTTLTRSGH